MDGVGLGEKTGRLGELDDLENGTEGRDGQGEGNQPSERTDGSHRILSFRGFHRFRFLFVLLRDDFLYSFLLLDDPPSLDAVVSGIESVLIDFVGQIPRLDGPVGGPSVYPTGGSGLARLLDLLGGGIAITEVSEQFISNGMA